MARQASGQQPQLLGSPGDIQRTCLLIAGMHRSGTSALTRVLSLLGADLPQTLMQGTEANAASNASGHWESSVATQLNDLILESAGTDWRSPEPVAASWYKSPSYTEMRERAVDMLHKEFGHSSLFVFKDPRVCKLVPFWLDAIDQLGVTAQVVSIVRNPLEVADSLQARNGIDPVVGQLLWLHYVLESEIGSRDSSRCFVTYDRLLDSPDSVAEQIGTAIGIVWPRKSAQTRSKISDFLSAALRHHKKPVARAQVSRHGLAPLLAEVHDTMDRWAEEGEVVADHHQLDKCRRTVEGALSLLGESVRLALEQGSKIRHLRIRDKERDEQLAATQTRAATAEKRQADERAEREGLREKVALLRNELGILAQRYEQEHKRNDGLVAQLDEERRHSRRLLTESLAVAQGVREETALLREIFDSKLKTALSKAGDLERRVAQQSALARERQAAIEHLRKDRAQKVAERDLRNAKLTRTLEGLEIRLADVQELIRVRQTKPLLALIAGLVRWPQSKSAMQRAERLALLRKTPLFDAFWYLARYEDVQAQRLDPAEHYLDHGGFEGRWPSEHFNGQWYLENNPDVREANINPLLHYLENGLSERREIRSLAETRQRIGVSGTPAAGAFPRIRSSEASPKHVTLQPGHWKSGTGHHSTEGDRAPRPWSARSLSFSALATAIDHSWAIPKQPSTFSTSILPEPGADNCALEADSGLSWFASLGHPASDRLAKLPAETLDEALSLQLCDGQLEVVDGWLASPSDLRVRFRSDLKHRAWSVRCYQQRENGQPVLCGAASVSLNGTTVLQAKLDSRYRPLLLLVSDASGLTIDSALVPFPSLWRGGTHFGEVAAQPGSDSMVAASRDISRRLLGKYHAASAGAVSFALSQVIIDTGGAIGTEPLLAGDLIDWLAGSLGVAIVAGNVESLTEGDRAISDQISAAGAPSSPRQPAATLHLGARSVPTLAAIFALDGEVAAGVGSEIHINAVEGLPACRMHAGNLPAKMAPWRIVNFDAPPFVEGAITEKGEAGLVLALCWPRPHDDRLDLVPVGARATLPFPAPAGAKLSVLIDCPGRGTDLAPLLLSVGELASGFDIDCTLIAGEPNNDAVQEAVLAGREIGLATRMVVAAEATQIARFRAGARQSMANWLLLLDQDVILHDQRLGTALFAACGQPGVGSVTALLVSVESGDRSKDHVRKTAGWIALAEGTTGQFLAKADLDGYALPAIFPVFAPDLRCTIIARSRFLNHTGAGDEIALGLALGEDGLANLAISCHTASVDNAMIEGSGFNFEGGPANALRIARLLR